MYLIIVVLPFVNIWLGVVSFVSPIISKNLKNFESRCEYIVRFNTYIKKNQSKIKFRKEYE